MKNTVLIQAMIALLITASGQSALAFESPPAPDSRKALLNTCLNEAQWLITHTAKYQNGSTQTKQKLRNSNNSEVTGLKALCSQMSEATPETSAGLFGQCTEALQAILKNHGDEASQHVERMTKICRVMTTV